MFKSACFFLLMFLPVIIFAQRLEVGGYVGGTNYFGDLAEGIFVIKETNVCFGGIFRYNLNPKSSIKMNVIYGKITADDNNNKDIALIKRGFTFESPLTEFAASYEWNILGRKLYNNIGEFRKLFTPYLGLGIGYAFVPGKPVAPADRVPNPLPEADDVDGFLIVPITGGVKYILKPNLVLGAEIGFRPTFTDYLDGVSKTGNPKANDWYMNGGFTVLYLFNKGADYMNLDKNF